MQDIKPDVSAKIHSRFNVTDNSAGPGPDYGRVPIDKKIGRKVRDIRVLYKLTQKELGTILNLSQASITNIETGNESLKVRHLVVLCAFFEIGPDYFMSRHQGHKYD